MEHKASSKKEEKYWSKRYLENQTGWDIGEPSKPLKTYIDQLQNKDLKILIPGAGNSHEAEYLFKKGFKNVYVLDIASEPLTALKNRVPDFPIDHIIKGDFFTHKAQYDLILEQTFFCAFSPTVSNRENYASKMHELLKKDGKLVGLWFDIPLTNNISKPPFGGTKTEYLNYLKPFFKVKTFKACYNSINARANIELFGIFQKI